MNNALFTTNGLDFLQAATLNSDDFNAETAFLWPDFLAQRLVTLFYADGGNGKSWLGFSLAKHCLLKGQNVYYLDFDNPLSVLKERNVHDGLVSRYPNLHYIQRSKCTLSPIEVLMQLNQCAQGNAFENCVFFIDSLRNFVNVNNDNQTLEALTLLMNLREAGATVVILHHSNKDGRNYQGSNHIRNSVDNMYQLRKISSEDNDLTLHLSVQKERAAIVDKAFVINTHSFMLQETDILTATLSEAETVFIQAVTHYLTAHPYSNKSDVLGAAGRKKDDKTARGWLDRFDGTYWHSHKGSGICTYQLIEENKEFKLV